MGARALLGECGFGVEALLGTVKLLGVRGACWNRLGSLEEVGAWILGRGSLAESLDSPLGAGFTEGLSCLQRLKEGSVGVGARWGSGDEGLGL